MHGFLYGVTYKNGFSCLHFWYFRSVFSLTQQAELFCVQQFEHNLLNISIGTEVIPQLELPKIQFDIITRHARIPSGLKHFL